MKTKIFTLFVALLATTCLWAQRFQVGDLYYEYSELPDVEPISSAVTIVWNPVGFVPCIENGSQLVLVGSHNRWGSEQMDYFEAIDGAPGWYKVVVTGDCSACKPCALAPDGSFSWDYEWIDLPGAPCEILASSDPDVHLADGYIIIPNYSTPIVYICSSGFKNNPCPENVGEIIGEVVVTSEFEGWSDKNYQNLSTAYIPETVVYNGKTYEVVGIDDYAFANSPITSITIPNSVTSIGNGAFNGCKSLTSITIPNSVTNIGSGEYNYGCWEGFFSGCSSLKSIIVKEGNPVYDSRNNCNAIVETATNTLVVGCQSTNMPSSITSIGPGAFAGLENLTSIYIPNSIMSIGDAAFQNCFTLTSITIPNSVTSIGDYAFNSCSSLTSVTIGNSVTSIGDDAFYRIKLTSFICYSPSLTSFGTYLSTQPQLDTIVAPAAFFDVEEAGWAYAPKHVRYARVIAGELSENAFGVINRSYKTLKVLNLAATSNTSLADEAFKGCYNLDSLYLPFNLSYIPYMAVADCKSLKSITIPSTVEEIDNSAFENCRSLNSIIFEGAEPAQGPARHAANATSLWRIGSWAFYNCHQLQNLTIPEGVTEVGDAAFYGCTYLEDMVLPSTIQEIGDNGFALCAKLKKMHVKAATPPTIQAKTFFDVNRQIPVYVPDNAVEAYKADPYWQEFNIVGKSNAPSAVDNISSPNADTHKLLPDGQLLIIRDGKTYTVMGAEIK